MLNTIIQLVVLGGLMAIYFISRQMIRKSIRPLRSLALSAEEVARKATTPITTRTSNSSHGMMLQASGY